MAAEKKSDPTGQICWLEIPVADPNRAGKFYTELFDWDTNMPAMPSPGPGSTSVHFFNKGDLHGAFLVMEEGKHLINNDTTDPKKMTVLTTFCVSSIEETLAKVQELGGKLHV